MILACQTFDCLSTSQDVCQSKHGQVHGEMKGNDPGGSEGMEKGRHRLDAASSEKVDIQVPQMKEANEHGFA